MRDGESQHYNFARSSWVRLEALLIFLLIVFFFCTYQVRHLYLFDQSEVTQSCPPPLGGSYSAELDRCCDWPEMNAHANDLSGLKDFPYVISKKQFFDKKERPEMVSIHVYSF